MNITDWNEWLHAQELDHQKSEEKKKEIKNRREYEWSLAKLNTMFHLPDGFDEICVMKTMPSRYGSDDFVLVATF